MIGGDHDVVEAGRMVLMGAGYTVAMARDVRDAIALRDHLQPDLLYIDVVAEGQATRSPWQSGSLRPVSTLPCSYWRPSSAMWSSTRYCPDGTMAPAPDFPEKPMEPAALVKNVRHALGQRDTLERLHRLVDVHDVLALGVLLRLVEVDLEAGASAA